MMTHTEQNKTQTLAAGALMLSIALLAFLTYREALGYFFTAPDALTQIDTSRVRSFKDIIRIFSEPMMNNTTLMQLVSWYRPTAILSYAIDYAIWGLNPFGYHLTDIMLHVVVSVMTFALVRRLSGNLLVAWLGAVLFAIHPVHIENVPAIARRHDAIAMVFMYISMFLFLRNYGAKTPSRLVTTLSLVSFAIALGAKEIAPIFPILVAGYVGIVTFPATRTFVVLKGWALKAIRPAIPYLVLTFAYVGVRTAILRGIGGELSEIARDTGIHELYMRGLLDPYRLVDAHLESFMRIALWIFVAVWIYWRFIRSRRSDMRVPGEPATSRSLAFYVLWLLLPLTILVLTESFEIRRLYIAVIPISALLALVMVDAFRAMRAKVGGGMLSVVIHGTMFMLSALVSFGLAWYSPLFRDYEEWRDIGSFSNVFLHRLSDVVPSLPQNAVLNIHGLPYRFMNSARQRPFVRTPSGLLEYSVKSWIDLNFPDNEIDVVLHERPNVELPPIDVELDVRTGETVAVEMFVKPIWSDEITKPINYRKLGRSYMDIGDYPNAVKYLKVFVDTMPQDPMGWAMLGEAYRELGRTNAAIKALETSLELRVESNLDAYTSLTRLLRSAGRFKEAEDLCAQWVEYMPNCAADAYRGMAWGYSGRGAHGKAIEYFLKSLEAEKSSHTYWGLLNTYVDGVMDWKKARQYAEDWVRFDNRDANAYLMLGLSYYMNHELDEATKYLEKSLSLGQRRDTARYRTIKTLGEVKLKNKDPEGSLAVFQSGAVAYPDSSEVHYRICHTYVALEKCGLAQNALKRAVDTGLSQSRTTDARAAIAGCRRKKRRG
jgi:Tfp pilus assembly protein PilF